MEDVEMHYLVKIVLIGNSGVGKTNLLSRFATDQFSESTMNTIGVDFSSINVTINDKLAKVQIWDTAGQEKYRAMTNSYYQNTDGALVVYDISDRGSFDDLSSWITEFRTYVGEKVPIMVLGNKSDLDKERAVSLDEANKYAADNELFLLEVSAKTNEDDCVNKAINQFIVELVKQIDLSEAENNSIMTNNRRRSSKLEQINTEILGQKNGRCC